ncbi:MAG: MiaB/RimO family radical SAM methylthiotransferase [Eggerthellaceae bacterium]|nr:MiaB/RimO family radical SAM methylthiotransferase [Eggerthellaceae bacterium]
MRSTRFCVVNLGCKVNRVESDTIAAALMAQGGVAVDEEDAELVVVNTCTVTGEADKKARKAVRHALKSAPKADVVVTGCAVAINAEAYKALDERVSVVQRAELLASLSDGRIADLMRLGEGFRTRVSVKVQDGCNRACTYCIVHVARGRSASVPARDVLAECERYLMRGVKELVLAGIDLGSYCDGDFKLENLVETLLELIDKNTPPGGQPARIRASSLEPDSVSQGFIDLMAKSGGRLCRHLHLPLQAGSTKVLREMARPYTADDFCGLVDSMYGAVPDLSLSTDIICGFPGESEEEFAETLDIARRCRFSKIHVFPYSMRIGTPAAARRDQVPPEVKAARAARLRSLADELRAEDLARRAGSVELALVEGATALTESYHEISAPTGCAPGSLVPVIL